jgi:hypothetical protein
VVAWILFDVGDHAGIENALAIVRGIKSGVEIQIGSFKVQTDHLATLFKAFRPSGSRSMSVALTGATGSGDST